ncbi:MAG: APC family permease [Actinomycetota bacterium]
MSRTQAALKRLVVGRPMSSGEMEHTLLPKSLALPVFSSDALSSVAYASQEILIVLGLAGAAVLGRILPLSVAVATLLGIVVISYRQTVRAYPSGGGAYIVAHENLGQYPGLLAGAALLIDYVLTVSVSITAGADAITSAAPGLNSLKVEIAIGFIVFVMLMNLRGTKESGVLFAIPTYGFVLSIAVLLITGGLKCLGGCPAAESADLPLEPEHMLTPFLMLRAFAAGTTALTGVEAISNGVPAFRFPQSRNAATTLAVMGAISISMFLGISALTHYTGVRYSEHLDGQRTVVAQVADAVFNGGFMFFVIQIMTAAILILAANTAYADFPRLTSILATDRFMPRQFMNRGDRLVFSNGIVILAVLASLLIVVFNANLTRLIQLYLVGVFVSFTLSQTGMVVHWRNLRERGWKHRAAINAFGATATGIVLCVVVATKFLLGAWIVVAATPILMYMMISVHSHYRAVAKALSDEARIPVDRRSMNQHIVVFVTRVDAAAARAVGYVRALRTSDVVAVALDPSVHGAWDRLAPDIPLTVIEDKGGRRASLKSYLRARREQLHSEDFLTVVIPEVIEGKGLYEILTRPRMPQLKAALLREPGVQVLDIPVLKSTLRAGGDQAQEPGRNIAVVLVSGVHNPTRQAIEFAETLDPTDLRAVSIGLVPEETEKLGNRWLTANIPHPLEIEASPYRDMGTSLRDYVRQFQPDGVKKVVTVVIPEFVVDKRRHQLLHGQTALLVKRHLLFEPGVVVASVPYHLGVPEDSVGQTA